MKLTRRFEHSLIFAALLSISLVMLIKAAAFGQSISNKPDHIRVEVANQNGSPVQLTVIGVRDNPNFEAVQMVEFTIQNISKKRIIAFAPFLFSPSYVNDSTIEGRYDFEPGKIIQTALQLDRDKLKSIEKLTLSIDYILFSDRTWWGPDTRKNSEFEAGYYDGEKYAIDQIKKFLKNQDKEELFQLLRLEEAGKIENSPPEIEKDRSKIWGQGFLGGYRMALGQLLPPIDPNTGKHAPLDDKMSLDDFACRLKIVEYNRSVYLDNPN